MKTIRKNKIRIADELEQKEKWMEIIGELTQEEPEEPIPQVSSSIMATDDTILVV